MTLKPCIVCGTPAAGSRCPEHTLARPRDHIASFNNGRWKALSRRLRRLSPFCEQCTATKDLTVDHVMPVADYPELTFTPENCRILCRTCNSKRGNRFTAADARNVLDRLEQTYRRRPTTAGRQRINVALRARGDAPNDQPDRPGGRQSLSERS